MSVARGSNSLRLRLLPQLSRYYLFCFPFSCCLQLGSGSFGGSNRLCHCSGLGLKPKELPVFFQTKIAHTHLIVLGLTMYFNKLYSLFLNLSKSLDFYLEMKNLMVGLCLNQNSPTQIHVKSYSQAFK